jgi:hypothetical protein
MTFSSLNKSDKKTEYNGAEGIDQLKYQQHRCVGLKEKETSWVEYFI